jgi:hypothetical protein
MVVAFLKLDLIFANLVIFCGYDISGAQKVKHVLHREHPKRI